MTRRLAVIAGAVYSVALFVGWSLCRVAAIADLHADDMFDLEPEIRTRPCPLCTSSNVYVDTEDVCFCITCRASYPLQNAGGR